MGIIKKKKTEKYTFINYFKQKSSSRFLNTFFFKRVFNTKNFLSIINLIFRINQTSLFTYFLFKQKNPYYYKQLMFLIKSNTKQYFLTFLGFNFLFFKTVSTGKILQKKNLTTKSLKSSIKANKYLLLFFNEYNTQPNYFISYYLLKPINRKNLNFFYLILKTYKIVSHFVGFRHHYKIIQKGVKRIKKRIKKKLLAHHTFYN